MVYGESIHTLCVAEGAGFSSACVAVVCVILATLPWTEHVMALKLCLLHTYLQYSIVNKTILTSLLPSILNTFTQNTMQLFFASTLYIYYMRTLLHSYIYYISSLDEKLS